MQGENNILRTDTGPTKGAIVSCCALPGTRRYSLATTVNVHALIIVARKL